MQRNAGKERGINALLKATGVLCHFLMKTSPFYVSHFYMLYLCCFPFDGMQLLLKTRKTTWLFYTLKSIYFSHIFSAATKKVGLQITFSHTDHYNLVTS